MKVQVMSPAADRMDFKVPPAPRLQSLNGKTIGLYNNMTGGADIAVDRVAEHISDCLLYTSPSPRDLSTSRMPSSA